MTGNKQEKNCKNHKHVETVYHQWITEEIKEEIKQYLETNEDEYTMIKNLWNAAKAVLRGKFIAIQAYLTKQDKSQTNNLTLHLKQLEREERTRFKLAEGKKS